MLKPSLNRLTTIRRLSATGPQPAEMSCLCPGTPGTMSLARMGCRPFLNQSLCPESDEVVSTGPGQLPDPGAGVGSAPPEIHRLEWG